MFCNWWQLIAEDVKLEKCSNTKKRQNMLNTSWVSIHWWPGFMTYLSQNRHSTFTGDKDSWHICHKTNTWHLLATRFHDISVTKQTIDILWWPGFMTYLSQNKHPTFTGDQDSWHICHKKNTLNSLMTRIHDTSVTKQTLDIYWRPGFMTYLSQKNTRNSLMTRIHDTSVTKQTLDIYWRPGFMTYLSQNRHLTFSGDQDSRHICHKTDTRHSLVTRIHAISVTKQTLDIHWWWRFMTYYWWPGFMTYQSQNRHSTFNGDKYSWHICHKTNTWHWLATRIHDISVTKQTPDIHWHPRHLIRRWVNH